MITAFHGIGAYRKELLKPLAMLRALKTTLEGVELCAADRPIGAFGVVVHGHARAVFEHDVWSSIGSDGQRVSAARDWNSADIFSDPSDVADDRNITWIAPESQDEFEAFAQAHRYTSHAYVEAWIEPVAIRAVWVKSWARPSIQKVARILAATRKIPLIVVSGTDRIDGIESLPFYWRKAA